MQGLRILCHDWLPSGTFVVSKDVYDLLQQQFGVENLDEKFLKRLGITPEIKPEYLFGKLVHGARCSKAVKFATGDPLLPDECTCGAEQAERSMLNENNKRTDTK